MSFGIVALVVLGAWSVVSIVVTVGLGAVIDRRDADRLHASAYARPERSVEQIAS